MHDFKLYTHSKYILYNIFYFVLNKKNCSPSHFAVTIFVSTPQALYEGSQLNFANGLTFDRFNPTACPHHGRIKATQATHFSRWSIYRTTFMRAITCDQLNTASLYIKQSVNILLLKISLTDVNIAINYVVANLYSNK